MSVGRQGRLLGLLWVLDYGRDELIESLVGGPREDAARELARAERIPHDAQVAGGGSRSARRLGPAGEEA